MWTYQGPGQPPVPSSVLKASIVKNSTFYNSLWNRQDDPNYENNVCGVTAPKLLKWFTTNVFLFKSIILEKQNSQNIKCTFLPPD